MAENRLISVNRAIAANLVIAIAKFIAAGITRSSAMLAEVFHYVVDTGSEQTGGRVTRLRLR